MVNIKNRSSKTSVLRSDLCHYSDAYIFVKGTITVTGTNNDKRRKKKVTFKNNTTFQLCISKINNTFIGNVHDLDIATAMCNLLEYSDNYSMTSETLWNF